MRKFKFTKKTFSLILFLIVLVIGLFTKPTSPQYPVKNVVSPNYLASSSAVIVKVARAVDGDTIELEDRQTVRYIGIDTPELHHPTKPVQCFAKEAMEVNKKLVEGKQVKLEKDVSEKDKYGRLLRFVYLDESFATSSGIFINDYLVRQGFAFASTFPPDVKFSQQFLEAEREARQNNRGLWGKCK